MKTFWHSTVSVAALLACAGAAAADDDFSGVAQVYLGGGTADGSTFVDFAIDDPFLFGGSAQGYWKLSPDVHAQVDIFAQHTEDLARSNVEFDVDESDASRIGAAFHLIHPFENRARFGVAGSIWGADVYAVDDNANQLGLAQATYGLAALEAQVFGDAWTFFGQAGLFDTISCDVGNVGSCPGAANDGTFARGKVSYFLNDNTALSVEGLQMWGNVDDDLFNGKSLLLRSSVWTVKGEYKFPESRYAGFLALAQETDEAEGIFNASADTRTISIGLKFYLDQPTVKANDRMGAAFDTPQFGNALEVGGVNAFGAAIGEFGCLAVPGGEIGPAC